jgi:hypothetical protein
MPEVKNTFVTGIMNKDLDERLIPQGVYIHAENVSVDSADAGNIGAVKNQKGNILIGNLANVTNRQLTNARTIGAVASEKDNLIYWLVTADEFDGIYEYNEISGNIVRVLQSNKSTPLSISKLNFNREFIVTGINYVNGFLYWTDNYNPPRKINISRVKADVNGNGGYAVDDPRIDQDINVIMAPPLNAPKLRFENTEDPNLIDQANNMEDRFLYFSYRYKYVDNQYSSFSPFSAVAFQAKDYLVDYNAGFNKAMLNRYNLAYITMFTGNEFVKEIQIIMRDARSLNTFVVDTINKENSNISDNVYTEYKFSNDKTYTVLAPDQLTRLFDNVPLLAKAQDYVGNRIMYGNYTQFYDVFEKIVLSVKYKSFDILDEGAPIQTFRSDRDYQVGIQYLDDYGRATTVLAPDNLNNASTVYIPPTQSNKGNSLTVNIANRPPQWATNYRLVIKQGKGSYYNIFPIYFYLKDQFRYFLIHESDKDKIPVGGYIIFKCAPTGPTFVNKKYKVIELKSQPSNFINGAQAGLYFKIKVDSPYELNNNIGLTTFFTESYGNDNNSYSDTIFLTNISPIGTAGRYAENPIYYGEVSSGAMSLSSPPANPIISQNRYNFIGSYRVTIQVIDVNQFRWTNSVSLSGNWNVATITLNTPYWINIGTGTTLSNQTNGHGVWIVWNSQPTIGDVWKINLRGAPNYNYFIAGTSSPLTGLPVCPVAIDQYNDESVYPGDIIEIKINETLNPNMSNSIQTFYSNGLYANLEEWFVESLAYQEFKYIDINGVEINEKVVSFRRAIGGITVISSPIPYSRIYSPTSSASISTLLLSPMYMLIRGSNSGSDTNRMSASITVKRFDNSLIAETVPEEDDLNVYHELSRTFPIRNNLHTVLWSFADATIVPSGPSTLVGKTNLGQLVPGSTPTTDQMHKYVVGESIYVKSLNPNLPNGYYEIISTPDPYNVIVDYIMPAYTTPYAGTAGYDAFEQNQTSLLGAKVVLNNPRATVNSDFNAWAYANGLESNRIRDDWNGFTLEYSPRTSAIVDSYGRKVSKNAICYSSIFGENTGVNRLNEFNLSTANFKYLDGEYGSIQKLYARESDILVLQEDKVSIVLYEKNILSDASGGGSIASIPQVLGNQIIFPHEYGISKNPESFATWGSESFFTDARRGVVLALSDNQIVEISDTGMKDYFIDLLRDYPNTQKLGAYDPNNQLYTLSNNSITILGCTLALSRSQWSVGKPGATNLNLFTIITDVNWSLALVDNGFGTNWVTGFQTSGFQSSDIFADVAVNNDNVVRSVIFRVTYCGKTVDFTLIQGRSKPIVLNVVVNHDPPPKTNN